MNEEAKEELEGRIKDVMIKIDFKTKTITLSGKLRVSEVYDFCIEIFEDVRDMPLKSHTSSCFEFIGGWIPEPVEHFTHALYTFVDKEGETEIYTWSVGMKL